MLFQFVCFSFSSEICFHENFIVKNVALFKFKWQLLNGRDGKIFTAKSEVQMKNVFIE